MPDKYTSPKRLTVAELEELCGSEMRAEHGAARASELQRLLRERVPPVLCSWFVCNRWRLRHGMAKVSGCKHLEVVYGDFLRQFVGDAKVLGSMLRALRRPAIASEQVLTNWCKKYGRAMTRCGEDVVSVCACEALEAEYGDFLRQFGVGSSVLAAVLGARRIPVIVTKGPLVSWRRKYGCLAMKKRPSASLATAELPAVKRYRLRVKSAASKRAGVTAAAFVGDRWTEG